MNPLCDIQQKIAMRNVVRPSEIQLPSTSFYLSSQ